MFFDGKLQNKKFTNWEYSTTTLTIPKEGTKGDIAMRDGSVLSLHGESQVLFSKNRNQDGQKWIREQCSKNRGWFYLRNVQSKQLLVTESPDSTATGENIILLGTLCARTVYAALTSVASKIIFFYPEVVAQI